VGPPLASGLARQRAAAILEVLAGGRLPSEAAAALGVSLARYYLLEQQALAGLVTACEPRPGKHGPRPETRLARLEQELARAQRECARQQALVRAAQRTVGLAPPPAKPASPAKGSGGQRPRRRRPRVRALRAVAALKADSSGPPPGEGVQRPADQDPGAGAMAPPAGPGREA
jgi:hypothetical protein